MVEFKIIFPSGYQIEDIYNDNIDIHIAFENNKVYFATLFTISNIEYLLNKDQDIYFWATNMLIVKDLKKDTIRKTVVKIINDNYCDIILEEIGIITEIYKEGLSFNDLIDMAL